MVRGVFRTTRAIGESEIDWRDGHIVLAVLGCIFGLDMFGFWLINGVADFSTGWFIGSLRTLDQFLLRAQIYVALVPVFMGLKLAWHRIQYPDLFEEGLCPVKEDLFNLDWFTNAVMLTAFPLALQDIGTWLFTTAVFVFGIFLLPRLVTGDDVLRDYVRLGSVMVGGFLTLWLKVNLPLVPAPETLPFLSEVAALELSGHTVFGIYNVMNSMVFGPFLVTFVSMVFAAVFTSDAFQTTPLLEKIVPERESWGTIAVSSFTGAVVYLALVWVFTGSILWIPDGVIAIL